MNQSLEDDLFSNTMSIHGLKFEKGDNQWILRKLKKTDATINRNIIISCIGLFAGLLTFLFIWGRVGIGIMAISISFLAATMNVRERAKEAHKKTIGIGENTIEIKEGYKTLRVNKDEVAEFRTKVYKKRNLFVGNIALITADERVFELLEIFGNKEADVQEDTVVISNYINNHYLS
ncbi:MAG TPA: hypothetical protein PKA00_10295 [Saprospiraceae bacterium]|nr:hypothetical protein [Saprospiraceae bacterium]HMQ83289.1 hypothetical protein [Saprospiraceae bacterium]